MHKIEKTSYGLRLTLSGLLTVEEVQEWCHDAVIAIRAMQPGFCVLADLRNLEIVPPEAQPAMLEVQEAARDAGMLRSAVVVRSSITALQFKKIARSSGIRQDERYVDADTSLDWEKEALAWLVDGTEPETLGVAQATGKIKVPT